MPKERKQVKPLFLCPLFSQVRRGDVLSAWAGIRPLVQDPNKTDTQSIARNHIVHVSDSGLVTIAGGKWTTYRSMASEALDAAIKGMHTVGINAMYVMR